MNRNKKDGQLSAIERPFNLRTHRPIHVESLMIAQISEALSENWSLPPPVILV